MQFNVIEPPPLQPQLPIRFGSPKSHSHAVVDVLLSVKLTSKPPLIGFAVPAVKSAVGVGNSYAEMVKRSCLMQPQPAFQVQSVD